MSKPKSTPSRLTITLGALVSSVFSLHAAEVTLLATDTQEDNAKPSFSTAGHWSDETAPSSGNQYLAGNNSLRTGDGPDGYVFAGDSLTLGDGTGSDSRLNIRTSGPITVKDLRLNHGGIGVFVSGEATLDGQITLKEQGIFSPSADGRTLIVPAKIIGDGQLWVSTGDVVLSNSGNTYSGGTVVAPGSTGGNLTAQADGALGSGNVRLTRNKSTDGTPLSLTLKDGKTNNYIADSAALIIDQNAASGGCSVVLDFKGVDTIGKLSFDGGRTWANKGTYGAAGSGADNESELFSGTGQLKVTK